MTAARKPPSGQSDFLGGFVPSWHELACRQWLATKVGRPIEAWEIVRDPEVYQYVSIPEGLTGRCEKSADGTWRLPPKGDGPVFLRDVGTRRQRLRGSR